MSQKKRNRRELARAQLRTEPEQGTRLQPTKNQGYQLPLFLWQELVEESTRRKRLGLPLGSQNAIAVQAITEWLKDNKGGES